MSILQHLAQQGIDIGSGHLAVDGNFQRKLIKSTPSGGGAIALTAAQIFGGLIVITPTAARNVTVPTAALLRNAFTFRKAGSSIRFTILNAASNATYTLTMVNNTGVTLAPTSIVIAAGESVDFVVYLTTAAVATVAVTIYKVASTLGTSIATVTRAYSVTSPLPPLAESQMTTYADIVSNQAVANAAVALRNSGLCTHARCLRVNLFDTTVTSVLIKGTVTIVGKDVNGAAITETIGLGQTVPWSDSTGRYWTAVTSNAFGSVTSVTLAGFTDTDGDSKVAVGPVDIFGLPTRPGGTLVAVLQQLENATSSGVVSAKTVGAVNTTYGTVVPATASNGAAGVSSTWIYTHA